MVYRHKWGSDYLAEAAKSIRREPKEEFMGSLNSVILIGNLGKDPELKFTQGGTAVCNFSIATTEKWSDDHGQKERTEWHKIIIFGKKAEAAAKYLSKGKSVFIQGKIQTRSWEDSAGQKRYTTEILAESWQNLSPRERSDSAEIDGGHYA